MKATVAFGTLAILTAALPVLAQPRIVPLYQRALVVEPIGIFSGMATQMAFGPDGRLYVMTISSSLPDGSSGVIAFPYDASTGKLGEPKNAARGVNGIGIAFHKSRIDGKTYMYTTGTDEAVKQNPDGTTVHIADGYIMKLSDDNRNGVYGEADKGELRVKIVNNLPVHGGGHSVDQLQIRGDSLYVGIGRRTINGRVGIGTMGEWSDDPNDRGFWEWNPNTQAVGNGTSWGDGVYNGTISMIKDLNTVVNAPGSANGYTGNVLSQALIQGDATPLSPAIANATNKLRVHSAGTRNPFGMCFDREGNLWFTNNYNRANTLSNGFGDFGLFGDSLDNDFSNDVHDQLFKAKEGADYGFWDANWRGRNPMLTPSAAGYQRVTSTTFDNLFNAGPFRFPDQNAPVGLGPHSSADGCAFFYASDLPRELQGNIFIARWNSGVTEAWTPNDTDQRTITYSDVVAVEPATGKIRRIATDFINPLPVLSDGNRRLLVADGTYPWSAGRLFAIRAARRVMDLSVEMKRTSGGVLATLKLTNNGDFVENNVQVTRLFMGVTPPYPFAPFGIGTLVQGQSFSWQNYFPTKLPAGTALKMGIYGSSNNQPFITTISVTLP